MKAVFRLRSLTDRPVTVESVTVNPSLGALKWQSRVVDKSCREVALSFPAFKPGADFPGLATCTVRATPKGAETEAVSVKLFISR